MTEWNNDEISKLIDFIEKRSLMCVIHHFSGARNCDELASKFFVQVSGNSFYYQFLAPVSVTCVAGLRRRHHCLIADGMILWSNFCPFPKKFALQFIDVRESSSVHFLLYSKHNSQQYLGWVSSVATNQACVEQIIVPYLGMILWNCFSKMFKIIIVIVFAR